MIRLICCIISTLSVVYPAMAAPKTYTILEVNGQKVPSTEAIEAWKSLFPEGAAPEFEGFDEQVRQNVLRGLVSERLLYKEAEKKGITKREEIQRRLRNLEKQMMIQTYIEELSSSFINDKALKKAYAQYASKAKGEEEVRARHILLKTKEEAEAIKAKLDAGRDFAKLAKTASSDKGSALRGGDLDYFTKDKMVKPFADAAFDLKPGEISKPVQSDFGWHVIKAEDRRPLKVRSFNEMQEQLKAELRKKGVERHVDQLMNAADVTYFSPDGQKKALKLKP